MSNINIKNLDLSGIDADSTMTHVSKDKSAYVSWAVDNKLYFSQFIDFEWDVLDENALVFTSSNNNISLSPYGIYSDHNGDAHIVFKDNYLRYLKQDKLEWDNVIQVTTDTTYSFAICNQLESPYNTFIGYIRRQDGYSDRLIIIDTSSWSRYPRRLFAGDNNLLRLRIFNNTLYAIWVETGSSSSIIKYVEFDILTSTFSSIKEIAFSETTGDIQSLDFNTG